MAFPSALADRADGLRIGMEMELAVVPFRTDDAGNESFVVTKAFGLSAPLR
jgi:hypothetical protein